MSDRPDIYTYQCPDCGKNLLPIKEEDKLDEYTAGQRKKIETLEKKLADARETLEIYANKDNWKDVSKIGARLFFEMEMPDDFFSDSRTSPDPIGGRIARECLKRLEDK